MKREKERKSQLVCVQWRRAPNGKAVGLCASSVELVYVRDVLWTRERRLLPVIRIGLQVLNVSGKMWALFWRGFLTVGPSFFHVAVVLHICAQYDHRHEDRAPHGARPKCALGLLWSDWCGCARRCSISVISDAASAWDFRLEPRA